MGEINNGYSLCFNEWVLDKEIKNELGLLLIISSLCAEKGYCWATNKYFAELFGIDEVSVSRKIKLLEKKKYISIEYEKRGCEVKNRYLRLTKMLTDDLQKNQSTINKNVKENNINNKNTNINNNLYNKYYKDIVEYLNFKTNSNYKYTTTKTQTLIKARFKEGFTIEDFKKVIDKKTIEWLRDEKMKVYLRPETLFGTKFESYLNQPEKQITLKDITLDDLGGLYE